MAFTVMPYGPSSRAMVAVEWRSWSNVSRHLGHCQASTAATPVWAYVDVTLMMRSRPHAIIYGGEFRNGGQGGQIESIEFLSRLPLSVCHFPAGRCSRRCSRGCRRAPTSARWIHAARPFKRFAIDVPSGLCA